MSLRHQLESQFPLGTSETQDRYVTVSDEGFKEVIKKLLTGKDDKNEPNQKKLDKWLETHIDKLDTLTFIDNETVTIGSRYAGFFLRDKKPIDNVITAFESDVKAYKGLYATYGPKAKKQVNQLERFKKEAQQFFAQDPDHNKADAFAKMVDGWEKALTPPVCASFKEPRTSFLGYGDSSFLETDKSEFKGLPSKVKHGEQIKVPTVGREKVSTITALIKSLFVLGDEMSSLAEDTKGMYLGSDEFSAYKVVLDNGNRTHPYEHRTFVPQNVDLFYNLGYRCYGLARALTAYLKALFT